MKKIYLIKGSGEFAIDPGIIEYIQNNFEIVAMPQNTDILLIFGGDGTMLKAIHNYRKLNLPFFGINYGHVGFLMNEPKKEVLEDLKLNRYETISAKMLKAELYGQKGKEIGTEYAFNDFYFERTMPPAARIRVWVNEKIRFDPLVCDGAIVSSAAGSTAYNASAGGVVVPLDSNNMVLTGISPAIFHRWYKRSTPLDTKSMVILEAINTDKRPVRFIADGSVIKNVAKAEISYSNQIVRLLFANSENFQEKRLALLF